MPIFYPPPSPGDKHFRVARVAAWTAPTAFTVVPYDTVQSDPAGAFTTGAAAHYTVPQPGQSWWMIGARVAAQMLDTERELVSIFVNGAEVLRGDDHMAAASANTTTATVQGIILVNLNDTIDIRFFNLAGAPRAVDGAVTQNWCWGFMISAGVA